MNKFVIACVAALSLGLAGCANIGAALGSPSAVADQTLLDEEIGITVEKLYQTATKTAAAAYRTGFIKPSTDAAVQRNTFCLEVYAGSYSPSDRGGELAVLECRLRQARDAVRDAYAAGNASSYDVAIAKALRLGGELIGFATKGDDP